MPLPMLTTGSLSAAPFGDSALNQLCALPASVTMILYHSSLNEAIIKHLTKCFITHKSFLLLLWALNFHNRVLKK